jgi:hypothetical protein
VQDQDNIITMQAEQDIQHHGNVRKTKRKTPSNYHLVYFSLWWGRMEREGKREAEAMKYKTEDEAASRGMRM